MHSEDSDQTGQIHRLICVFTGRTGHFVGFVMRRLISRDPDLIVDVDMPELVIKSWAFLLHTGSGLQGGAKNGPLSYILSKISLKEWEK